MRALRLGALALLSGVLWFLGCPDFDLWPLSWVAMVPALYAAERASTTRQAFFYAWLAGAVGNGGGFYWITNLLVRFGHLPWAAALVGFVLLCAYHALVFGAFGAVTRVVRQRTGLPAALVAPLAMVTFELALPVIFPFYVAICQAWQAHVIQVADLAGPLGVTALLLMVNGAVYDLLTERRRRIRSSLVAAGVMLTALGYGHFRIRQVERARAAAPQIDIGLVQPNVPFDQKGVERAEMAPRQLDDLQEQSRRLSERGADLIIWPETSYPFTLPRTLTHDFREGNPFRIRVGFDTPLVVGAVTRDRSAGGQRFPYNSVIMVDREGNFTGRFDKTFLLVFGEYTPGREIFPWITRLMPDTAGHYAAGSEIVTLPFRTPDGREWRLGPMICYEDILAGFGRELAARHPHLLVNVTNDTWFGETSEPWEHLALSVFRAVEMRTDLVRAVNTGVSAFVDAAGRVYARTYAVDPALHPRAADSIMARAALIEGGHTVYAKVGNLFAYLCAAATAVLLVLPRLRRRRAEANA